MLPRGVLRVCFGICWKEQLIIGSDQTISRYHIDFSLKNGLGKPALSLYLTGCDKPVKCEDCHNYELQDRSKQDYNLRKIKEKIKVHIENFKDFYDHIIICYLGGEPLTDYNKEITYEISKYVKKKYSAENILYSWRTIKKIKEDNKSEFIKYMDYGVLGSYNDKLFVKNTIPASKNQFIYDFNKNRKLNSIKLN